MEPKSKMSPEEARSFSSYSTASMLLFRAARRDCACQPYRDAFTFRRWLAQGFVVRKGEKAVKLPLVKNVTREGEDGEVEERRVLGSSAVFCRCQVKALD